MVKYCMKRYKRKSEGSKNSLGSLIPINLINLDATFPSVSWANLVPCHLLVVEGLGWLTEHSGTPAEGTPVSVEVSLLLLPHNNFLF